MEESGDCFSSRICTLSEEYLMTKFIKFDGVEAGIPFYAWGKNYVYFPSEACGYTIVGCAPRNPTISINEKSFVERCKIAEECLPQSQYRRQLEALHRDMLSSITLDNITKKIMPSF
jgi:hypothetical protein